jgi:hypothetical protein
MPTFPVTANRTQARTNHYAHRRRTRLPERTVADIEWSRKQSESVSTCEVGLGCPSRFAGGQRTMVAARKKALNARACRAQKSCTLRASSMCSASMQARGQIFREQVRQPRLWRSALRNHPLPARSEMQLVFQQPPNPSIEGTASGLRPSAAPHVKR